jgi:hypothetical protein
LLVTSQQLNYFSNRFISLSHPLLYHASDLSMASSEGEGGKDIAHGGVYAVKEIPEVVSMFRIHRKLIDEGEQPAALVIKLVLEILLLVDALALI